MAHFMAILPAPAATIELVGRDELEAVFLPQALVQRIAIVGEVPSFVLVWLA
jgi:hypothetical protein